MDSINKNKTVAKLAKATDGLTEEEFVAVCEYFALLINPETKAKATKFGERIVNGGNISFHDLQIFCRLLHNELILNRALREQGIE